MTNKTGFIKIKTGLLLKSGDTISMDNNYVPTHSPEFNQKVYDKEEQFRTKIILQINEAVGLNNWAIRFGQMYEDKEKYITDIYAENENDYNIILNILGQQVPLIELMPIYKGTIDSY